MLRALVSLLRRLFALGGAYRHGTLIIQPLPGIGDMIWHLPHLHSIAQAEGPVTLLTKPRSLAAGLLCGDRWVRRILWLERNVGRHDGLMGFVRLVGELRKGCFRRAWLLHGSSRYAWALLLAGVPETVGYGRGMQKYLLSESLRLPVERLRDHPIAKASLLLELAGIPMVEAEPCLYLDGHAEQAIERRFGHLPRPWIALGIGSSEPYKQWGERCFAGLALNLLRQWRASVFIIGGPAERRRADEILERVRRDGFQVIDAVALSIEQTAALLSRCRLYVGNDTGVLNMAAALRVPAIGLFGGSAPLRHSRFIHSITPPAGKRGMQSISVGQVWAEIERWPLDE